MKKQFEKPKIEILIFDDDVNTMENVKPSAAMPIKHKEGNLWSDFLD